MTQTLDREAAVQAQLRLDRLARCREVRAFQAGDEQVICANDGFLLTAAGGHLVHSTAEIAAMRAMAAEGRWP